MARNKLSGEGHVSFAWVVSHPQATFKAVIDILHEWLSQAGEFIVSRVERFQAMDRQDKVNIALSIAAAFLFAAATASHFIGASMRQANQDDLQTWKQQAAKSPRPSIAR